VDLVIAIRFEQRLRIGAVGFIATHVAMYIVGRE